MMTVQQPHCPRPHPNFGPRKARSSARTYSNGVAGSASTVCERPLTFSVIVLIWPFPLSGGAGLRIPPHLIRQFFEMRAGDEFLVQVHGIAHDRRDDEPGISIRLAGPIVKFGNRGFLRIRIAVLPQIPRL